MEKTKEEKTLDNLKVLYQELAEVSNDESARIDLDLLFVDILDAIGLNAADHLAVITGEEIAVQTMEKVRFPLLLK